MDAWERTLEDGPHTLSRKQMAALAGMDAQDFLERHEEFPEKAGKWPKAMEALWQNLSFSMKDWTASEHEAAQHYLDNLDGVAGPKLFTQVERDAEESTGVVRLVADSVLKFLEDIEIVAAKQAAKGVTQRHNLHVVPDSLEGVAEARLERQRDVMETLRQRLAFDYGEPEWTKKIPTLDLDKPLPKQRPRGATKFSATIEKRRQQSEKGLKGKRLAPASLAKYERHAKAFVEHSGKDDIRQVTKAMGEAWRDRLVADGNSPKVVNDKIANIRTLMNWAQAQNENKLLPDGNPFDFVEGLHVEPLDNQERTYTESEAVTILRATRQETANQLRWVPWVMLFGGLRVGEACQLESRDLEEFEGRWFLKVRVETSAGRTTKAQKARVVPIHRTLESEGFVEALLNAPRGKLVSIKSGPTRIGEWIRNIALPEKREKVGASHGLRQLLEDLMVGAAETPAKAIMGRTEGGSRRDYLGSKAQWPELLDAIDKVKFPRRGKI